MRLRSRYELCMGAEVHGYSGGWVQRWMGAAVDGCGGGWVRRWMDGDGVMDRDTHINREWVCGVYSQLEWFSNAHNALLLRWLL
jgi:hypothetical protein